MDIETILNDIKSDKIKKVIIYTDAANELDDQFAIAYAVGAKKIDVLSINATHFSHNGSDLKEGMEKSYEEIKRVLKSCGKERTVPVFKGSYTSMDVTGGVPIESPAVENIINTALFSDDIVYILGIGAATNIASAIALCPEIKDKIVVIWLGCNDINQRDIEEYNLVQDFMAGKFLLDSKVPLILCPALFVTSVLKADISEFKMRLFGKNGVKKLLWELINLHWNLAGKPKKYERTIWDIAAVSLLSVPSCATFKVISSPLILRNRTFSFDESRHLIIYLEKLDRDSIYSDMWAALEF